MDIGGAELSIFSMTLITIVRLYYFSIANFKALSIYISISYSWTFEDTIAEPRDYCESLCTGTSLYDSTPLVMLGGMPPVDDS